MQAANVEHIKEEKKIPNLRFPEFKGEWEKSILKKEAYVNPKSPPLPEGFIYIDLESVNDGILTKEELIKIDNAPSRAQRLLAKEDILFQTVRPYQRNNLFFNKEGDYVASTGYAQIKAKANPKYLYQFLHTAPFVNKVIRWSTGTSYPAISPSDLVKIPIAFPSLPEQQKIASFLSAVDQKIQQLTRKKELLEQYKKGVMQKIFSREIRFKDENGNDFPDWEEKRLGEIFKIKYGKDYKHLNKGSIPVLGTGGVMTYVDKFLYDKPSVLIGRKGSISTPQFIEVPFWTVDTTFYTEISEDYNPYLVYQLVSNVNWMKYNEATGVPSLNTTGINSVKVFVPKSLDEQKNITKILRSIDNKIESIQTQITQTQKFKNGLLQQMFV